MRALTLYTLYGRRAGAEMCFEKTLAAMMRANPTVEWTVFCNQEASRVLQDILPQAALRYIPLLNNQFKKALWLEVYAKADMEPLQPDVFWNPSGCNHFPGKWPWPTLTTFHDLGEYHVKGKYDFKRTIFRKMICIPRSVKRSAAFTAVSAFTAGDMEKFLKIPPSRISVVHNGPSPYQIGSTPNARQVLDGVWPLGEDRFLFIPGRTDYIGKGLDILLNAYAGCREKFAEARMKLIFSGPPGDGHERFLAHLNKVDAVGRHVRYLGRVAEEVLQALYQECYAVVLPSRFEGFGFPVLEAMDAGVPVLCSDAGSLPEVAGGAALLFRSGDVGNLQCCLLQLMQDASLRHELIQKGQQQSKRFSWDTCGTQMLKQLESAAILKKTQPV